MDEEGDDDNEEEKDVDVADKELGHGETVK